MPIYQHRCQGCERVFESVLEVKDRHLPSSCPECESPLELIPSIPGITRLEPIPMGREGWARRAAARRERITGKPAKFDITSNANNSFNSKRGSGGEML